MKKIIILALLSASTYGAFCKPSSKSAIKLSATYYQKDTLNIYTGKYQSIQKKGTMTVDVTEVEGQLIATASWDGSKLSFKHLNGDNFIVTGHDWSIKFNRDKDKDNQIKEMVVAGATTFTKVPKEK